MQILKWLKKKLTPAADVYYVPDYELTPEEQRELAALKGADERLSMVLKLMKTKEKADRIKNDTSRSIRG